MPRGHAGGDASSRPKDGRKGREAVYEAGPLLRQRQTTRFLFPGGPSQNLGSTTG